jgi:hypothetical protein
LKTFGDAVCQNDSKIAFALKTFIGVECQNQFCLPQAT